MKQEPADNPEKLGAVLQNNNGAIYAVQDLIYDQADAHAEASQPQEPEITLEQDPPGLPDIRQRDDYVSQHNDLLLDAKLRQYDFVNQKSVIQAEPG